MMKMSKGCLIQLTLSVMGEAIITTCLKKYFPADFLLFILKRHFCNISGPTMEEDITLASKLSKMGPKA